MILTIHAAAVANAAGVTLFASVDHSDLIARLGDHCERNWHNVSGEAVPGCVRDLIDAYFAGSQGDTVTSIKEHVSLPEPYASAPALLRQLDSLVAALHAYKPGDGEGFATLCAEASMARELVVRLNAVASRRFTVFCQQGDQLGTIHIDAVEAADLESAILAGRAQCLADWNGGASDDDAPFSLADIHCLGVAEGDIRILHWEDQTD